MRRRQLGAQLRRLREDAGVSQAEVSEILGCSVSRAKYLESGRNVPKKAELSVLADRYGAPAEVAGALEELRREASRRGWWSTYRLPAWLQAYVGVEADATHIRAFELELVPGLLQTPGYARRTHELAEHMVSSDDVNRLVDARILRQRRLTEQADPLVLEAVVSEAAIRRVAADPDVGPGQLDHLVKMAKLPNVSIRVLPTAAGLHAGLAGPFLVMNFDPEVSLPIAYQEYAVGGHLVDDQDVVSKLLRVFERLSPIALGEADSVALIGSATTERKEPT